MEAMKINIPVQRKTSIESNWNPESKDQNSKSSGGLTARPGGLTGGHGPGGLTGNPGGLTGEEQRRNLFWKTAREQDLKSI